MTPEPGAVSSADAVAEQIGADLLGALRTLSYYVGERLGWYAALAAGALTPVELAARTGTDARYAQEWLELQAATGILTVDPSSEAHSDPRHRRFTLPDGAREALLDVDSLAYVGALPRLAAAAGRMIDPLLSAYRGGSGVRWSDFGADAYEAQAALNRPWFTSRLAPALASVPELGAVLGAPGARLVDLGCGGGWASIALARAYPRAAVTGLDVDLPSLDLALRNASKAGVQVEFRAADGAGLAADSADAVFLFECLHDMSQPVDVLRAVRTALRPGGIVVVMDEAVAEHFTAPADAVDQLMYGFSLFICLPDGRSQEPSAATGTVMRPAVLESYAKQAGFLRVEVLPIEDFSLFRFYRLHA